MKKNFVPGGNPVYSILGLDETISEKNEEREATSNEELEREETQIKIPKKKDPVKKGEFENILVDLSSPKPPKPESRSKRLNLLVKPSTLKEITKIAAKHNISVNELINRLLESCVKSNQ